MSRSRGVRLQDAEWAEVERRASPSGRSVPREIAAFSDQTLNPSGVEPMSEPEVPKKKKRLDFKTKFAITQLLLGKLQEWLKADRPSYAEVCRRLEGELGQPMDAGSLATLCKEAGIVWSRRTEGMSKSQKFRFQLVEETSQLKAEAAKLRAEVNHLNAMVALLAAAVRKMATGLGEQLPPGLALPPNPNNTPVVQNCKPA
jgi:hypothetical protein